MYASGIVGKIDDVTELQQVVRIGSQSHMDGLTARRKLMPAELKRIKTVPAGMGVNYLLEFLSFIGSNSNSTYIAHGTIPQLAFSSLFSPLI